MKNLLFLFFTLLLTHSFAQMQTWERVPYYEPDPLPLYENQLKDSQGNFWHADLWADAIYRFGRNDTTVFNNFPTTGWNDLQTFSLGPDDKIALTYHNYKGDYYFGFFNGQDFQFFSEAEMNLGTPNKEYLHSVSHTLGNVWLKFTTKIVRFNKDSDFKLFGTDNTLMIPIDNSTKLLSDDSLNALVINHGELFSFKDGANSWQKININDSISNGIVDKKGKRIFLFGKSKIYVYTNGSIDSYTLPNSVSLGKREEETMFYSNDLWIVWYQNGMVIWDKGIFNTFLYSDYFAKNDLQYTSPTEVKLQENGILIIKQSTDYRNWLKTNNYFSYKNNSLKLEQNETSYESIFYKEENNDIYLVTPRVHYISMVKNKKDSSLIKIPLNINWGDKIVIDDKYIWLLGDSTRLNYRKIINRFRIKRDKHFYKGRIFYDNNKNGIQDAGEVGISKFPLTIGPLGIKVFSSDKGDFAFAGTIGENYTLSLPADVEVNYSSKPLPYPIKQSENNIIGITLANPTPDVTTNFYLPWSRCNTTSKAILHLRNIGFANLEKAQVFLIADPIAEVSSDDQKKVSQSGDTLTFEINNLAPGKSDTLNYSITWPAAELTGQKMLFRLEVKLFSGGKLVKNIKDSLSTIVRCSYDPNDKAATPAGIGSKNYTLKDIDLSYLIRFENTGNDTAYHVTIYDTLDANLDYSTFKFLGASHNVITNISPTGEVVFYFENIMLPDTGTNEEKAQGFVRYSIAHKKDIADFTPITNVAGIVFDSNIPIMTNTVSNVMVSSLEGLVPVREKRAIINKSYCFPNPAKEKVTINIDEFSHVEILDYSGKQILRTSNESFNVSSWPSGLYLIKIYDKNGILIHSEKLIKN